MREERRGEEGGKVNKEKGTRGGGQKSKPVSNHPSVVTPKLSALKAFSQGPYEIHLYLSGESLLGQPLGYILTAQKDRYVTNITTLLNTMYKPM